MKIAHRSRIPIEDISRMMVHLSNSFLRPESMELIDSTADHNAGPDTGFGLGEAELLLLIGVAGSREVVERHLREVQALGEENKAQAVTVLSGSREKVAWATQGRIHLSSLHSTSGMVRGQVAVPLDQTGDMFQEIRRAAARHQLQIGITGHAGNGILYAHLPTIERNARESEVLVAVAELIQVASELGGFFVVESGPPEVRRAYNTVTQRSDYQLMKHLKQTLDPNNILNPGKAVGSW